VHSYGVWPEYSDGNAKFPEIGDALSWLAHRCIRLGNTVTAACPLEPRISRLHKERSNLLCCF
jgi:hypothetical protein